MHINAYKIVKLLLILISAYISITAFGGGFFLLIDSTGANINLHMFLEHLPFGEDYFVYAIMLIVFNGISQMICLMLLLFHHNKGGVIAGVCAGILLIWVTVQLFTLGWFFLSTLYFILAIVELIISLVFCHLSKKTKDEEFSKV